MLFVYDFSFDSKLCETLQAYLIVWRRLIGVGDSGVAMGGLGAISKTAQDFFKIDEKIGAGRG